MQREIKAHEQEKMETGHRVKMRAELNDKILTVLAGGHLDNSLTPETRVRVPQRGGRDAQWKCLRYVSAYTQKRGEKDIRPERKR